MSEHLRANLCAAALLSLFGNTIWAQNYVANPSFETLTLAPGEIVGEYQFPAAAMGGWYQDSWNFGYVQNPTSVVSPTDGDNLLYLFNSTVRQDTRLEIWNNTSYSLDVDVLPAGSGSVSLFAYDVGCYPFDLKGCGVQLAKKTFDGSTPQQWTTLTLDWDSKNSPYIGRRLAVGLSSISGGQNHFDNVVLTHDNPNPPAVPRPDSLPDPLRTSLYWPGTGKAFVNVDTLVLMNSNVMHTFPSPPGVGSWIGSTKPAESLAPWLDSSWGALLDELHKEGVAVYASAGSIAFEPAVMEQYGYDPNDYYARDHLGNLGTYWSGSPSLNTYSASYTNPHWMTFLEEVTMAYADAGFDGMWYDLNGYYDPVVLYSHSPEDTALWQQHMTDLGRDPNTPQPNALNGENMSVEINRIHLKWRWQLWQTAFEQLKANVQAQHPDFVFGTNNALAHYGTLRADDLALPLMSTYHDYIHYEDYGHGSVPFSVMPTYLMAAAVAKGRPVVQIQNDVPIRNATQARIAQAEALAAGGSNQNVYHIDAVDEYHTFVEDHAGYFTEDQSAANVAVVASIYNKAFYERGNNVNPSYWMGQMLIDLHVPFDYIILEDELFSENLSEYDSLILPDIALLSDQQIAVIDDFLNGGGNVYATHDTGTRDENGTMRVTPGLAELTSEPLNSPFQVAVGQGRLAFDPGYPEQAHWFNNPRDLNLTGTVSYPSLPPQGVQDALDFVFGDSLPLQIDAAISTAVTLREIPGALLVHLVNYNVYPNGATLTPDQNIMLSLDIPIGMQIAGVQHVSPDLIQAETLSYLINGSQVDIMLDELLHYSLLVVSLSVSGDFDNDGDVDGRDFLMWQRGESPNPGSSSDLVAWQTNFGQVVSMLAANSGTIPEPSSFVLLLTILACSLARRPS